MIIVGFCAATLFVFVITILFKPRLRQAESFAYYTYWSAGLWFFGLILFGSFSIRAGMMRLGVPQTVSFPQDYLARGIVGWGILLIGLVGVLSPVWAALISGRRDVDVGEESET